MFFESKHSLQENEFSLSSGKAITFPLHMHRSFEYFLQISGQTEITVDSQKYTLSAGFAVLIFPFQIHSYLEKEQGEYEIGIFAPEIVPEFQKKINGKLPTNNLFFYQKTENLKLDNIFLQKAHSYKICGEFDCNRTYAQQSIALSDNVTKSLLLFAEENYCKECSLKTAANAIGYDYVYISKFFKRKIGIPFNQYINILRIKKSTYLLRSTSKSILEIMTECGFQCSRTFNRAFLSITGVTPTEYKQHKNF